MQTQTAVSFKSHLREFWILNLGTFLTAVGSHFFKFPNHFSTGGVTGLSVVLVHYFPNLSNSLIVTAINLALLVVGLLCLGKGFGFKTIYVTVAMSMMLEILEQVWPLSTPLTNQPLLELLFGVFLPAWGSALLFDIGSSTGGTDIIAMIVKQHSHVQIGKALLFVDFFITALTFAAFGPTTGLFSMLGLFMRSYAVDFILAGMNSYRSFTIITEHPAPICDYIRDSLGWGATVSRAEGMFEHTDKTVVLTALSQKEGNRLQEAIQQADPHAFVMVGSADAVIGKGFRGGV